MMTDWTFFGWTVPLRHGYVWKHALFCLIIDDIGNIIDAAKRAAAEADRTTSDTMNQLNDIKAEVTKISITPSVSNIDSVLDDVELTGKCCACCY